jgi:outer membrane receptor for ferrienterochelin and colicin
VRGPRALQRHVPVLIGKPHHDVEAPVAGPYVVVNLSTSYAINQNLEVFGVIENLFDTEYSTFGIQQVENSRLDQAAVQALFVDPCYCVRQAQRAGR